MNNAPLARRSASSLASGLLGLLLLCSMGLHAQPRYSPQVRSDREVHWMQDSLHISDAQLKKITAISLPYQQQMDAAANDPAKKKKQARLMRKKDVAMKSILDEEQYRRYIAREAEIRRRDAIVYKGHQPY